MTEVPQVPRLFVWPPLRQFIFLVVLGLATGFLSGMFGVGGGIIIIPVLTLGLGFTPKRAAGTSLASIVILASVGVISYAQSGSVSWVGALLLACGALVGTQIGSRLLERIRPAALQFSFGLFMIASAVMLFINVPSRDASVEIDFRMGVVILTLGFFTGILAGLMGIGGGIIVVPALMLIVGASDLVAKGTSLLMMIPAAIGGTVPNYRRGNVDLATAAIVGVSACSTTFLGAWVAQWVSPLAANISFAVLIVIVAIRTMVKAAKTWKA